MANINGSPEQPSSPAKHGQQQVSTRPTGQLHWERTAVTRRIHVRLPAWLWGDNPREFAAQAGLELKVVDRAAGTWTMSPLERVRRAVAANLIRTQQIAGRGVRPRFDLLETLGRTAPAREFAVGDVRTLVHRMIEKRPGDIAALLSGVTTLTSTAPVDTVAATALEGYQALHALRGNVTDGPPLFPEAAVHLIRVEAALHHRCVLPRVLLRIQHEPAAMTTRPSQRGRSGFFASGFGLSTGQALFDAYLAPLLSALSPWVWALPAPRMVNVVLFDLGRLIAGMKGDAAEPLALLGPPGIAANRRKPPITPSELNAALQWWIHQLDLLFTTLTDVTLYRNGGWYSPLGQLSTLLTVEQLFRHVQSILTQTRNKHAQRVLLAGALDTLERLNGRDLPRHGTLRFAKKILDKLEVGVPTAAAPVLLPAARAAVAALAELQDGFFLRRSPAGTIRLPDHNGAERDESLEQAAAAYLLELRNSTHGFGGRSDPARRRADTLLAAHTGELPDDLALLAYLYLLDLLADPDQLAQRVGAFRHP